MLFTRLNTEIRVEADIAISSLCHAVCIGALLFGNSGTNTDSVFDALIAFAQGYPFVGDENDFEHYILMKIPKKSCNTYHELGHWEHS
jgi:hypothetical protein